MRTDDGESPGPAPAPLPVGGGFSLGFIDAGSSSAASRQDPPHPEAEGSFVLREMIGAGGQGEVWEAWQSSLRRVVAVKVHRSDNSGRFLREALLTGQLDHPSIVPVLDLGSLVSESESQPRIAMAMKRLRGERWDGLVARERDAGCLTATGYLSRHVAILESVCQALAYAHSKRVLHLDLKPSQVIVGEFGEVYLCDWGMAARMGSAGEALEFVSPPAGAFGTPGFMAPEQALGDLDSIGVATDIYLLGGLVHFLVTGRAPHGGATTEERIDAARRNEVAALGDGIPQGLRDVVATAMDSVPARRFADVESFRRAVAAAMQEAMQGEEAARICARAASRLGAARSQYGELASLEQEVDRALALSPGSGEAARLRDAILLAHGELAIAHGDLALARVLAERIRSGEPRGELRRMESRATAARLARERQRIRLRRALVATLGVLVVVLVGASIFLYTAVQREEAERVRAELALAESRRELARASLQAALSFVEKHRPADARDSLRRVPMEWRGWEWGYLASMATPERRLHQPRSVQYSAVAGTRGGGVIGAIRKSDAAMLVIARGTTARAPIEIPGAWRAISAAGDLLLAGSAEGVVLAHDGERELWRVNCGDAPITALAGDDAGLLVAADAAGTLWRIGPDQVAVRAHQFGEAISVLSAERGSYAVGTASGEVWHAGGTGDPVKTEASHLAGVRGIAWHPTERWFATWAGGLDVPGPQTDGRAIIHAIGAATPAGITSQVEVGLTALAWTSSGGGIAMAFTNAWFHEVSRDGWRLVRSLYHGVGVAHRLHFFDEGRRLAFLSRDAIQVRESEWLGQELVGGVDSRAIIDAVLSGTTLLAVGEDGGIAEWSLDRPEHADVHLIGPDRISSLDIATSSPAMAAAHQWGWLHAWSVAGRGASRSASGWLPQAIRQVRVSPDGSKVLALLEEGRADLLARNGGEYALVGFRDFGDRVGAIALHPDGGSYAVAPQSGGVITVADASTAKPSPLPGLAARLTALEYIQGGDALAVGGADGSIQLVDPATGGVHRTMRHHTAAILRLNGGGDEGLLVAASADESASLWELASGDLLAEFRGTHSGPVVSAVLTPDGRRVITASGDAIVRIFDRESGSELLAFGGHEYAVLDMDITPDGMHLLTSGMDGTLRVWMPLPWDGGDGVLDAGRP